MLSTLGHNELASPPTRSGFMFPYAACPSRLWACLGRHWSDPVPSHSYGVWGLVIRAHRARGLIRLPVLDLNLFPVLSLLPPLARPVPPAA